MDRRFVGSAGLVVLLTGNGKGKTTSALGMALRARGHGMRVAVFQFIKKTCGSPRSAAPGLSGEIAALKKIGIPVRAMGSGFVWKGRRGCSGGPVAADERTARAAALGCWQACKKAMNSNRYDMLVFDEITYPVKFGWLKASEIVRAIKNRPRRLHVILTGRGAPKEFVRLADTASEVREIKHAMKKGIPPLAGIEH